MRLPEVHRKGVHLVPELTAAGLTLGLRVYQPTHMIMIPKVYETIQKKMQAEIAKRPLPVRAAFFICCKITSYVRKRTGIRLRWLTRPFYAPALGKRIVILGCGAEPCELETVQFFLADVIVKKKHIRRSGSRTADVKDFPLERRRRDTVLLNGMMRMFRSLYDFEVTGTEQLRPDGHYIFCPNHESHLDGLWVWTALKGTLDCSRVACLAKQEHLDTAVTRQMLRMLGGIPTDRSGNPAPAMERAEQVIRRGDTQFLIHPEGTRTRNGEMGSFKKGVASLSMDTGVPIVPVCITGAYEIYPAGTVLPKFYDFRHYRKPRLKIAFGAPILPAPDDTADTLTEKLYRAVTDMKKAAL